jgi:hypothetical protein
MKKPLDFYSSFVPRQRISKLKPSAKPFEDAASCSPAIGPNAFEKMEADADVPPTSASDEEENHAPCDTTSSHTETQLAAVSAQVKSLKFGHHVSVLTLFFQAQTERDWDGDSAIGFET